MKVYIAAPYELRKAAQRLMRWLEAHHDVRVTSEWLRSEDALCDADARRDLLDIDSADLLVELNPEDFRNCGTGGRHVELGYALAKDKSVIVAGVRSNIFHHLNQIVIVPMNFGAIVTAVAENVAASRLKTSTNS